jgi:NAD(P)-dependent dehydrogenase (short-subunit alcohol dehydrogenase family)
MSQESKKPRIFITGHTRGIGKAIFDRFKLKNFYCYGVSKSTGYDIESDCDIIVRQMANFDFVVLNAYSKNSQEYNWYCRNKKALIEYIEKAQQDLYDNLIQIYDICPDTVKTDMSKGLWEEYPKLHADEVAEVVEMCFTKPYNINKIVMQKYGS